MFALQPATWVVIVASAAVVVGLCAWFFLTRKQPQRQPGKVVARRPAGPARP